MDWLWESVTVPRILLLFLFGVGIAWTLDTIARPLLKKSPKTVSHHLNNRNEYPNQKQLNQETTDIKLVVPGQDVKQQEYISNTKDCPENDKNNPKSLVHADDSTMSQGNEQPKENFTIYVYLELFYYPSSLSNFWRGIEGEVFKIISVIKEDLTDE
jgi:hypothetical protein